MARCEGAQQGLVEWAMLDLPRGPGAGAATLSCDQALVAEAGWMVRETADGKPLLAMPLSTQAKW